MTILARIWVLIMAVVLAAVVALNRSAERFGHIQVGEEGFNGYD